MDDHFDIGRVFEIGKFDITRLTCSWAIGESSDTSMSTCDGVGHITGHWEINKTLAPLLHIEGVVVTDK